MVREHKTKQLEDCILYAINYDLKLNNFSDMQVYGDYNAEKVVNAYPRGVQCPDNVVRKDEEPVNIDFTSSEIQNTLFSEIMLRICP